MVKIYSKQNKGDGYVDLKPQGEGIDGAILKSTNSLDPLLGMLYYVSHR
jgi:hypothetical protein